MRKTSHDGMESSSLSGSVEKCGILKSTRNSIKRKVQNLSHESDDTVVEPLLVKDKTDGTKLGKMKNGDIEEGIDIKNDQYNPNTSGINDKLKLLTDQPQPPLSECVFTIRPFSARFKDPPGTTYKKNTPSNDIVKTQHEVDTSKGIDSCSKNEQISTKEKISYPCYNPSPLIFTTAKIHADAERKVKESVISGNMPISSTTEKKVEKNEMLSLDKVKSESSVHDSASNANSPGIILTKFEAQSRIQEEADKAIYDSIPNFVLVTTSQSINTTGFTNSQQQKQFDNVTTASRSTKSDAQNRPHKVFDNFGASTSKTTKFDNKGASELGSTKSDAQSRKQTEFDNIGASKSSSTKSDAQYRKQKEFNNIGASTSSSTKSDAQGRKQTEFDKIFGFSVPGISVPGISIEGGINIKMSDMGDMKFHINEKVAKHLYDTHSKKKYTSPKNNTNEYKQKPSHTEMFETSSSKTKVETKSMSSKTKQKSPNSVTTQDSAGKKNSKNKVIVETMKRSEAETSSVKVMTSKNNEVFNKSYQTEKNTLLEQQKTIDKSKLVNPIKESKITKTEFFSTEESTLTTNSDTSESVSPKDTPDKSPQPSTSKKAFS